jgi:hypothetical protein
MRIGGCLKENFEERVRVARFFLAHDTKTGKNVPIEHTMCQMVKKIPNV